MQVDYSENVVDFIFVNLVCYCVVVFVSIIGDVFDDLQQVVLEGFICVGNGFVGLYVVVDIEYDWLWYGYLVGVYFYLYLFGLQISCVQFECDGCVCGVVWIVYDELYNYCDILCGCVQVVVMVDECLYDGGCMGNDYLIIWCYVFDGGCSWYIGLGYDVVVYCLLVFEVQVWQGLCYVVG